MHRYVFGRTVSYTEFFSIDTHFKEDALAKLIDAEAEGRLDQYADGESDPLTDRFEREPGMSEEGVSPCQDWWILRRGADASRYRRSVQCNDAP